MADQIHVTTDKLRETAQQYAKYQAEMRQTCADINTTAQACREYWAGSASDAFQNRFSAMFSELKQTDSRMQEAVDGLKKAAGIFDESERQTLNQAQGLETGKAGLPGEVAGIAASLFS